MVSLGNLLKEMLSAQNFILIKSIEFTGYISLSTQTTKKGCELSLPEIKQFAEFVLTRSIQGPKVIFQVVLCCTVFYRMKCSVMVYYPLSSTKSFYAYSIKEKFF